MQKRRTTATSVLPMTVHDNGGSTTNNNNNNKTSIGLTTTTTTASSSLPFPRKRIKSSLTKKRPTNNKSKVSFVMFLFVGMIMVSLHYWQQQRTTTTANTTMSSAADSTNQQQQRHTQEEEEDNKFHDGPAPLRDFHTLDKALQMHVPVVALYFAASWCPMSTPVTEMIQDKLASLLVDTTTKENQEQKVLYDNSMSLIYVSSDQTKEQFDSYVKPNWLVVPYDDTDERDNLKRHFLTAAKNELQALGMKERQHEIPTLIILSGSTRQVLTYRAIDDLKSAATGQAALDHWLELERLNAALNEKFAERYAHEDENYHVKQQEE